MSEPGAFAAPLQLTEKAKTSDGAMQVVLDRYPSGALSVRLIPEASDANSASACMLSADLPQANQLTRGEFIAACKDPVFARSLLRSGLFRSTGRHLEGEPVWSLDGLAMIELLSACQPPIAASKVSFPAHLFQEREFAPEAKKRLIQAFENEACSRHSAQGASVWVIKQHCERQRLPFNVYLLKNQETVAGVLVCKRAYAAALVENESRSGITVQMVYESPQYA